MRRLDGEAPRAVLEVLVEGLEEVEDVTGGGLAQVFDDDAEGTSTYACGVGHAQRTLPVRKARDAWRLAAERGILPAGWIGDPRRCFPDQEVLFFCGDCHGMGATGYNYDDLCAACGGRGNAMRRGSVALPTSIAEVRWMLAHPGLVEQAEALAREAVRRLGETGRGPPDGRVQWGRVRQGKAMGTVPVIIASPIWDLTRSRRKTWDWERMKGPAFTGAPWWPEARGMHELTRQILCFDVGMAWADQAAGVAESPFEPVLRLWELGVMIEELTAEAIVLERARHRYVRSWRAGVPYG